MQPIDPPTGGGRLRLYGLYSGFKNNLEAIYIGSYDWKGPQKRSIRLSPCLEEIDIPLSDKHFEENEKLNNLIPGKTIIDVTFPLLASYSQEFITVARDKAKEADIVIFSHPWLFWSVSPVLNKEKQTIIYDSQNCEGLLRTKLLADECEFGQKLAKNVVKIEFELCHAANFILACSEEDKNNFIRLYNVYPSKILVVPNGVFTSKIIPVTEEERKKAKHKLKLDGLVATFIGSNYQPNVEAAKLIIETAKKISDINFIIMGGVGESLQKYNSFKNLRITGFVNEDEKLDYLAASDIGLNPMLSGSGTNIKMFDYMAAGIPIITTKVGARGIPNLYDNYYLCDAEQLTDALIKLSRDNNLRNKIGQNGRKLACEKFSWENISIELGVNIERKHTLHIQKRKPFFSVIVPTYERPDLLLELVKRLNSQIEKDFELIIIDQSKNQWTERNSFHDIDIIYFHTNIKGAVKARNTGIRLANGRVIAFIDDDCQPSIDWLSNAKKYFLNPQIVGVEGIITSSKINDPNYRTVTNVGFEGMGFMTANLFIRKDIIDKINGFDERFDNPHFREDTDLAWRAQEYGLIPYAKDVEVYHPPHKRDIARESEEERNKFFVHDPLLFSKHPNKYIELFIAEGHYKKTKGFWEYFIKGMERHGVSIFEIERLIQNERIEKKYILPYFKLFDKEGFMR